MLNMITKTIYLYKVNDGVLQTPVQNLEATLMGTLVRLIADEGKELVKGDYHAKCIDVKSDDINNWTEVDISSDT